MLIMIVASHVGECVSETRQGPGEASLTMRAANEDARVPGMCLSTHCDDTLIAHGFIVPLSLLTLHVWVIRQQ
jgi:hypothetical protein